VAYEAVFGAVETNRDLPSCGVGSGGGQDEPPQFTDRDGEHRDAG
jgi:hypothetical protein